MPDTEQHVCTIYLQHPDTPIARSEFPDPLVTLDYDDRDHLIAVSAPGIATVEYTEADHEREQAEAIARWAGSPQMRESLEQADRDLAEGRTRPLSDVLTEMRAEREPDA